jgi:hypothetical protein
MSPALPLPCSPGLVLCPGANAAQLAAPRFLHSPPHFAHALGHGKQLPNVGVGLLGSGRAGFQPAS